MSIAYNSVCLIGRLTRDPESKFTPSGTQVATFKLAVNRNHTKGEQKADFIHIVAFGKLAEVVSNYCEKGKLILVDGELNIDQYEKDGDRKSFTKVIARKVQFLEQRQQTETAEAQPEFITDENSDSDEVPF
jgi:single-strand DNA-binding protein